MKSLIIYYSQAGSTRKVARAIAEGMSPVVEQCDMAQVKEVDPRDLERYDLIGLGSPVWMGAEPPNVRRFIESLPKQQGKHLFSFNTHGVMPELYFPSVVRRLRGKGFTVIGWRDWYGGVHFQTVPSPYPTDGHPDAVDLAEAGQFGREMAGLGRRIAAGETDLVPPPPPHVLTYQLLVLNEFYQSGHNPHGRLQYDAEKCNYPKCHLCMDNCLMGYIDLSASPRVFGSKKTECDMWMGCTFCELICPTGAIHCDWEEFLRKEDNLSHILDFNPLEASIEEAEAAGRFRRLVPKEEIRWENLYFRVHNKHPRFIIPR